MKRSKISIALITILIVGVAIRIYLCLIRNIFTDEVFYFEVIKKYKIKDFILITHWIKDHGILYFIFLQGWLSLAQNIVNLRLTNILLYIGSALTLFKIFKILKFGKWSLLPVLFFSVHRYFIFMSSMILPYNLVVFFSILSIYFCTKLFISQIKPIWFDYVLFIIFTSLAFYADYSFLSMIPFYCGVLFAIFRFKKKRLSFALFSYIATAIFIIPGIFQILHNLRLIQQLNNTIAKKTNILLSLYEFCKMTLLQTNSPFSSYIFGLYFALFISGGIFIFQRKKHLKGKNLLLILTGASWFSSIFLFLLINQFLFAVFVQRSFWFFFLFEMMLISSLIYLYFKKNKTMFVVIIITYFFLLIFNIFKPIKLDDYVAPGDIAYEISYGSFFNQYSFEMEAKGDKYLFVVDDKYLYYPLTKYYLASHSLSTKTYINKLKPLVDKHGLTIVHLNKTELSTICSQLRPNSKYSIVYFTKNIEEAPGCSFANNASLIYLLKRTEVSKYALIRQK